MLRSELLRRSAAYNSKLKSMNFQNIDIEAIKSKIAELSNNWDTTASAETITKLNQVCSDLEAAVSKLNSDIDKLKSTNIDFSFIEKLK